MNKIGFIGTGIMGKPMARNLISAGYELNIFARNPEKIKELEKMGAVLFPAIADMAADSPIIITMLPDSSESEEVIIGKDGIASAAKPATIVVDMSSIDPMVSIRIGKTLEKKEIDFLDAPVSGGEEGAVKGELAIMAGGKVNIFQKVKPIFEVLGSSLTLVGETGAGNFTKLANQMIVALNIVAMSEAFILARKAGLSLETVYRAIKGGLAGSNVLDSKAPRVFIDDFKPGFKIKLHYKDLQNALSAANALEVPLPFTSLANEVLKSLKNGEFAESDHGAIIKFFEKISNIKI